MVNDDTTQRDDCYLSGATTDVHNHAANWLLDGEASANRRCHGLLNNKSFTCLCVQCGITSGTLLNFRHSRRNAYHNPRSWIHQWYSRVGMGLLDKVGQHLLYDVKVGDHSILERTHRNNVCRRLAYHGFGLSAHGMHTLGAQVDRNH